MNRGAWWATAVCSRSDTTERLSTSPSFELLVWLETNLGGGHISRREGLAGLQSWGLESLRRRQAEPPPGDNLAWSADCRAGGWLSLVPVGPMEQCQQPGTCRVKASCHPFQPHLPRLFSAPALFSPRHLKSLAVAFSAWSDAVTHTAVHAVLKRSHSSFSFIVASLSAHLSVTISPRHTNLQVVNFQRHQHVPVCQLLYCTTHAF